VAFVGVAKQFIALPLLLMLCNSTQWQLPQVHGCFQAVLCCWTEEYWGVSGM